MSPTNPNSLAAKAAQRLAEDLRSPQRQDLVSHAFETPLGVGESHGYKEWKRKHAPGDSGMDYDLRGAFKAGVKTRGLGTGATIEHSPDTFKKPNHPSFSVESMYSTSAPDKAGSWNGDKWLPPINLNSATQREMKSLRDRFSTYRKR